MKVIKNIKHSWLTFCILKLGVNFGRVFIIWVVTFEMYRCSSHIRPRKYSEIHDLLSQGLYSKNEINFDKVGYIGEA